MIAEIATLYLKITDAIQQKTPFVSYRKPNSNTVKFLHQKDAEVHFLNNFSQSGFVFAPFDDLKKTICYDLKNCNIEHYIFSESPIKRNTFTPKNTPSQKREHISLVKNGIDFIKQKKISKIVLSRKETLNNTTFDCLNTFKNLLQSYTSAFVYLWYHPKIGLWLGATPETLIKTNNNNFKTMSLAGTQIYDHTLDVIWEEKEKQEHQFVTDYITRQLEKLKINYQITKPFTVKAGNMVHLCANISGRLDNLNSLESVIKALHPTPAVCGLPKDIAKQFIIKNESYDREYYTGFLGELNFKIDNRQQQKNKRNIENHAYNFTKKQSAIFVNLRCMKINKDSISLYIGGGITKDSNPEKEYQETIVKATTIKKILINQDLQK